MARNFLSISGSVSCIQGNDAYAPKPYWDTHTFKQFTPSEIADLTDDDFSTVVTTLSPGEYTCLEISFPEAVYASELKVWMGDDSFWRPLEVTPVFTQKSKDLTKFELMVVSGQREDYPIDSSYWDRISLNLGYLEGSSLIINPSPSQTVSSFEHTGYSGGLISTVEGLNPSFSQLLRADSGPFNSIQSGFYSPPGVTTTIHSAYISDLNTSLLIPTLSGNTQDHGVQQAITVWRSDNEAYGHFEGSPVLLSSGVEVTGIWSEDLLWQDRSGAESTHPDRAGYTFRQLLLVDSLQPEGDGLRVTVTGSVSTDVHIRSMSYMPANASQMEWKFGDHLGIEQVDLKKDIVRWYQDSEHWGHFEGAPVDIDDGSSAVMITANVILIPAQGHGLQAGDYIRIEGTQHYDGYYYLLTTTTLDTIVITGIYNSEMFTSTAKIRKIISLGPKLDQYGEKMEARDVVSYCRVNFASGATGYVLNYNNHGRGPGTVRLGPDEYPTVEVASIYDVTLDEGWLTNSPGPSISPDYESTMPRSPGKTFPGRTDAFTKFDDLAVPDPGFGYDSEDASAWAGSYWTITEAEDPEIEGDWTGWRGMGRFFDGRMSQPLWVYMSTSDCIWITLCYRGPVPVKWTIDMGKPMVWNKYRMHLQSVFCPNTQRTIVSKPKKWKLQGSNQPDNIDALWTTIHEEDNYDPDLFYGDPTPPDGGIGYTSVRGQWHQGRSVDLYRYYRFWVEEVWIKSPIKNIYTGAVTGYEAAHISEIEFVQHRSSAGIFPLVVTANIFVDKIKSIVPDENLQGGSRIYYSLSFDGGDTYKTWSTLGWKTIAQNDSGIWKYLDSEGNFSTAEDNSARKALWHAFSVYGNRMSSDVLSSIPQAEYVSMVESGLYLKFGVGLVSTGRIEAMLKSISVEGTIYNPSGSEAPAEVTFNGGQTGCIVSTGTTVESDWLNVDIASGRDLLFVVDLDDSPQSVTSRATGGECRFFERGECVSYDLQTVDSDFYTLCSGVVFIERVDSRWSDTVTLTASGHTFSDGSRIRIWGLEHYNYEDVEVFNATSGTFDIVSRHWLETMESGVAAKRYDVGEGYTVSGVQVGSILEFLDAGSYVSTSEVEAQPSGLYLVSESYCEPGMEAWNAFDVNPNFEFHSGRPGVTCIGLYVGDQRCFNKLRIKASSNEIYWDREFPKSISVSYSTENIPDLENEAHWVVMSSGILSLPLGPRRFSDWLHYTCSGYYNHFRIKIESNYGNWYDCIRFAEIDIQDHTPLMGYTLIYPRGGTDAKYLFDGSSFSNYASSEVNGQEASVCIDYRNRKRVIDRFRLKTVSTPITEAVGSYGWRAVHPKDVKVSGGNSLDEMSLLSTFSHPEPIAPSSFGEWLDISIAPEPYRYYKFCFTSTQGAGDKHYEISEMDLDYIDNFTEKEVVTYSGSFPIEVFNLPRDHQINSITVDVIESFRGGYIEQIGTEITGDYPVSFWTIADLNNQLTNGKSVSHIGVSAEHTSSLNIDLRLFEAYSAGNREYFNITTIATVTHSGSGFQWFELSQPYTIPDDDCEYFLGWYQPELAVEMGIDDAFPSVAFEYGDYVGTNIRLKESAPIKPCLAYRYASYLTVGTQDDPTYFFDTLSPTSQGHQLVSTTIFGPSTSGSSIYIYHPEPMLINNTQGQIEITVAYRDVYEDLYGASLFTVSGSSAYSIADYPLENITDSNTSTVYASYRDMNEVTHTFCILRFSDEVYMNAFRLQSPDWLDWEDYFPRNIAVRAASNPLSIEAETLSAWEELYKDAGVMLPQDMSFTPWIYFDTYECWYRYYLFDLALYNYTEHAMTLGGLQSIVTASASQIINITEPYGTIQQVMPSGGVHHSGVKLLYNAGSERQISAIYNTFTNYERIEASPGTYFYRGENNPEVYSALPSAVYKEDSNTRVEIPTTYESFAGMAMLAWHRMDESSGDFGDSSGQDVIAYRVGLIDKVSGRLANTAGARIDGSDYGYARFTLPHHLTGYTVAFWFKPDKDIYRGYTAGYDLMGGWASYGAVPGNWHVSLSRMFAYEETPYPPVQATQFTVQQDKLGSLFFGNYGGYIQTSRQDWSNEVWYHVVFGFSNGSYKIWVNGIPDENAFDYMSPVYPPSSVIVPNPDDFHYSDYNYANSTYFGLPLKDSLGSRGEFSLQNVMHFGKLLSDEEVFQVFRFKALAEEQESIYFSEDVILTEGDRLIFEYEDDVCITRFVPNLTTSGSLQVCASGVVGWEVIGSVPDVYNPAGYGSYSLLASDTVSIQNLKLLSVDLVPTVSGIHVTTVSGAAPPVSGILQAEAVEFASGYSDITCRATRDHPVWYAFPSGRCGWQTIGSGELFLEVTFDTEVQTVYPRLDHFEILVTDWSTVSGESFYFGGNPGVTVTPNQYISSDWLVYPTEEDAWYAINVDTSSDCGAVFSSGYGFLTASGYTCSGSVVVDYVTLRSGESIELSLSSTSGLSIGDTVKIFDDTVLSGVHSLLDVDLGSITIESPYTEYIPASAYLRKITRPSQELYDIELTDGTDATYTITSHGDAFVVTHDLASCSLSGTYCLSQHPGSLPLHVTKSGSYSVVTGPWSYEYVGRIAGINVRSYESHSSLLHAVSFDNRESFKIFQEETWVPIIKEDAGVWKYFDGSWNAASGIYDAFDQAIDSGYSFTTEDLEGVEEYDWHITEAAETSSGTLDFISRLSQGSYLESYSLNYVQRDESATDQSWATSLVPSGWAYNVPIQTRDWVFFYTDVVGANQLGYAFDGTDTVWISNRGIGYGPFNLAITFVDKGYTFKGFRIKSHSGSMFSNNFPSEVEVWASDAAGWPDISSEASWVLLWKGIYPEPRYELTWGPYRYFAYIPNEHRHIKFKILANHGSLDDYWVSFSEIELLDYDSMLPIFRDNPSFIPSPETSLEMLHDRKDITNCRLYMSNPSNTSIGGSPPGSTIAEVSFLDGSVGSSVVPSGHAFQGFPVQTSLHWHCDGGGSGPIYTFDYVSELSGSIYNLNSPEALDVDPYYPLIISARRTSDYNTVYYPLDDQRLIGCCSGINIITDDHRVCGVCGNDGKFYIINPGEDKIYSWNYRDYDTMSSGTFSTISLATYPSGVFDASAVYDSNRDVIWVQCFDTVPELWKLDCSTGSYERVCSDTPSGTGYTRVVFDSHNDCLWSYCNNLYRFDCSGEFWSQESTIGDTREGSALVYYPDWNSIVIWGGSVLTDTWVYDIGSKEWTDVTESWNTPIVTYGGSPSGVLHSSLFHIAHHNSLGIIGQGMQLNRADKSGSGYKPHGSERVMRLKHDKFNVSSLTDTYIGTGGVYLKPYQALTASLDNIPNVARIFYGKFSVHYDPSLSVPELRISFLPALDKEVSYEGSDNGHGTGQPFSLALDDYWGDWPSDSSWYSSGCAQMDFGCNPYCYIDFSHSVKITAVRIGSTDRISWEGDFPSNFHVYGSNDKVNWTLVSINTINTPPAENTYSDWVAIDDQWYYFKYWCFNFTAWNNPNYWLQFSKFDFKYDTSYAEEDVVDEGGILTKYIFRQQPLESCFVEMYNLDSSMDADAARITEIAFNPITDEIEWSIPDDFNLLESAYSTSITGSISGAYQYLHTSHLVRLFEPSVAGALPLFPSSYIGVVSDLSDFSGRSREIRLLTDNDSLSVEFYTQSSGSTVWAQHSPSLTTWSGHSLYYYTFPEPSNIRGLKTFCSNSSSWFCWLRSLQLVNAGDAIDFGPTGSSGNELDLRDYYRFSERVAIYNNTPSPIYANARLLPRFSNDYDLDRIIQISEDGITWSSVDTGVCYPEDMPFGMGKFEGTQINTQGYIELDSVSISGTWISPVIEVLDPSSTAVYIYTHSMVMENSYIAAADGAVMNVVEVASSNIKPTQIFMVTGLDTEHQYPAPWKTVAFKSDGSLISWERGTSQSLNRGSLTNPEGSPARYWQVPSRPPLWQFWGCVEPDGWGAVAFGLEYAGGDPIYGGPTYSHYDDDVYCIRRVFPEGYIAEDSDGLDESAIHIFKTNVTEYSDYWGSPLDILYPRIVPIFNRVLRKVSRFQGLVSRLSWQVADIVYRPEPFYEQYQEDYYSDQQFHLRNIFSYYGESETPEENNEIDYVYSFTGTVNDLEGDAIRCAGCVDGHSGGLYYWIHFANTNQSYYRTLLVNGTAVEGAFTGLAHKFNFMVEGSPEAERGFWGISDRYVVWYSYDGSALTEQFRVTTDGTKPLKHVTHGAVDYNNNLWVVDLPTERVIRINFNAKSVDYSREVSGASSVYPDPHDGSAYIYVIRDPQYPANDCVKIVHATEYDYIEPEVVCVVPGVSLVESQNIRLTGRSLYPEEDYWILDSDTIWANPSWSLYSAGSPTLPKGQYKQFKITLRRNSVTHTSPAVSKIRIPRPALLNKIPWHGSKYVYVDTVAQTENPYLTSGEHTADLLIWWVKE